MDGVCDREQVARDAISKSLTDIGRRKHALVLDIMHGYLTKHNKVLSPPLVWLAPYRCVVMSTVFVCGYSLVVNTASFYSL